MRAFGEFFRDAYQPLVRDVIFAGGDPHEAEDAVSAAMLEVLQRWGDPREGSPGGPPSRPPRPSRTPPSPS